MNESKQIDALKALSETARERQGGGNAPRIASVRVSSGSYLAVASVLTFASALLLRGGNNLLSLVALALAWMVIPILAYTDRIVFDGQRLMRFGVVPFFKRLFTGRIEQLKIADFETVETTAMRTLRRGGTVRFRYCVQINGKGHTFVLASGGRSFRRMIGLLFPLIHEDKMDNRSRDLRDYLVEPKSLQRRARLSQLAPVNVLDVAEMDFKLGGKKAASEPLTSAQNNERAYLLRRLANELRIAGRLTEAGEAFRRALNARPGDGWAIYDFARLLRSQASARSDARLLSRARAALRLAGRRGGNDDSLLALIGETSIECGDVRTAQRMFEQAIKVDERNVKARFGMADLALREGKLAHVIHHYREAAMIASEKSSVIYARREADYYARLNDDEDYLSAEVRRINFLQHATRLRRLAARVTNAGILFALAGSYIDPKFGTLGWSLAASALLIWLATLFSMRYLSARRKPEPI